MKISTQRFGCELLKVDKGNTEKSYFMVYIRGCQIKVARMNVNLKVILENVFLIKI